MENTNLKKFFDFDNWKVYTPKMAQNFIFPEPGLEKFFHDSKLGAIDFPTRKTLVGSKISSKIDFYSQISTF